MIKKIIEQVLARDLAAIWSILSPDDKRLIISHFRLHQLAKNRVIYSQGDQAEHLWTLLRGKVKVYKEGISGRQQIIRLVQPVQYFGYRAYFAEEAHTSSAATFETSLLGTLPLTLVRDIVDGNKQLAWFFIRELSRNLGGSDTRIVNLTQKRLRARLAEALCVLIDNYGYEEGDTILRIYLSREDLANLSNMTTSNAIRTLAEFADEHLILVDGRRIRIVDAQALRRISRQG